MYAISAFSQDLTMVGLIKVTVFCLSPDTGACREYGTVNLSQASVVHGIFKLGLICIMFWHVPQVV